MLIKYISVIILCAYFKQRLRKKNTKFKETKAFCVIENFEQMTMKCYINQIIYSKHALY